MHELTTTKKARKRVGRGGKYRKTAGRGTKGQKARSGGNVDPLFEGGRSSLVQRMKKNRGFKAVHAAKRTVSLTALERAFDDGATVSLETLVIAGVLRKSQKKAGAKIVATGTLTKKLTIAEDVAMSRAAAAAIAQAAGGVQEKSAAKRTENASAKTATQATADDLTKIEGIGPKIAETLSAAGISTFADLAETDAQKIAEVIADVRGNHTPDTWPQQAALARDGKWDELAQWQEELDGGKA